ncbi:FGGY-family carbohydrate kinase [Georgenia sp. SUBG003]|uniref:FGGY-family carbohydrate kinase n=1 Tax=Georgenia sp. SUBG003 TaxID=1497974 RepID=UPI0005B9BF2E
MRTVLESLAVAYAREVADLSRLTGISPDHVVVVGGGVRNTLLVEMTAAACRLPVVAGAAEASAVGSALAQLQTLGHLGPDDGARVLAASVPTTVTEPGDVDAALHPLADLADATTALPTDRKELI